MNRYRHYSEEWLLNSGAYGEHVSAMTGEKLHSKSDIAAELAWRDDLLAKANERAKELECENLSLLNTMTQYPDCFPEKDKQALNKFAIEQKILELIEFREQLNSFDNRDDNLIANAVSRRIEQLRKEQEQC